MSAPVGNLIERTFPKLAAKTSVMAHLFDHPATIAAADKFVPWVYPTGSLLLLGGDMLQAKNGEERRKFLLRDALVLGATVLGTMWATRKFMVPETEVFKEIKEAWPSLYESIGKAKDTALKALAPEGAVLEALKTDIEGQEKLTGRQMQKLYSFFQKKIGEAGQSPEAMHALLQSFEDVLPLAEKKMTAYLNALEPRIRELEAFMGERGLSMPQTPEALKAFWPTLTKAGLSMDAEGQALLKNYIEGMNSVFENLAKEAATGSAEAKETLSELMENLKQHGIRPHEKSEFWEEVSEAREFFTVGLFSVASGVLGGLVANKLTGSGREIRVNIFKEAAFQFIANIALCAVGAIIGLTTANALKIQNRFGRFGIISAGLSLGICGGGYIANFLGRTLINPLCDWFEGGNRTLGNLKDRLMEGWQRKEHSRRIEFADVILHLDDLPTALAIAGMKIFGPFIPPFFAFSGYRAGIGYRNEHDMKAPPEERFGHAPTATPRFHPPSRLMTQNSVFQTFYQQQHPQDTGFRHP